MVFKDVRHLIDGIMMNKNPQISVVISVNFRYMCEFPHIECIYFSKFITASRTRNPDGTGFHPEGWMLCKIKNLGNQYFFV